MEFIPVIPHARWLSAIGYRLLAISDNHGEPICNLKSEIWNAKYEKAALKRPHSKSWRAVLGAAPHHIL